jgi:hypothetical protein
MRAPEVIHEVLLDEGWYLRVLESCQLLDLPNYLIFSHAFPDLYFKLSLANLNLNQKQNRLVFEAVVTTLFGTFVNFELLCSAIAVEDGFRYTLLVDHRYVLLHPGDMWSKAFWINFWIVRYRHSSENFCFEKFLLSQWFIKSLAGRCKVSALHMRPRLK